MGGAYVLQGARDRTALDDADHFAGSRMKTAQQLIADAKAQVTEVTAREVQDALARGEPLVLVDVREQNEWNLGHAAPAEYIGRGVLESQVESRVPRDARVVLMCASGNRSALAAVTLQQMGYANVASMAGGFRDWVATGGSVAD
jgi:rhodanese-related sulfurtransferase